MRMGVAPGRAMLFGGASAALAIYAIIFSIAPLQGEDFAFARRFVDGSPAARLAWMLEKWPDQFLHWNARLGEQLAIFWLNVPAVWYLVAACLAFIALHVLIAALFPLVEGWGVRLTLSLGLTFLLWPGFEVFFWKTANAGYLHPLLLNLICVVAFTSAVRVRRLASCWRYCVGLSMVGFLAGFSFENMPVAVAAYMLVSWALLEDRYRQWRALLPIMAVVAGWVALILVPSTGYRRSVYRQLYGVGDTDVSYYLGRAGEVTTTFLETTWLLLIVAIIALLLLAVWQRHGKADYDCRVWWLLLPVVLVIGSVAAAPYTEPRAFLLAWVLMIVIVIEAAHRQWRAGGLAQGVVVVMLMASLATAINVWGIYRDVAARFGAREQRIVEHLDSDVCREKPGLAIGSVRPGYPARYFNGRDAWTMQNLLVLESYYGCWLALDEADG